MKILVTGRDGQVAQSLAERHGGHELIFVGRPDLDLADAASIERVVAAVNPELVISAAAYTAVDKAEDEPDLAMAVNGEGPGVLARAAARISAPVIHLSTDYVFDGGLDRPWREDDAVAPLGVYGRTKLAGEEAVAASGAAHAILRTAWVYGPFGANFVKTMLRLAADRDTLNVVEDQIGCPTSSLDIADGISAVIAAWQRDPAHGANAVYHFAGAGETSWADFARAIFAESVGRGGPGAAVTGIPASAYPTRAVRPANSRLDCTRFASVFNHSTPLWQQSLSETVARLV
ncbi:dTDP-4-dehydrorhamnose reductase [Sphingomonas sp. LT1P40]|uniref:dTDP-4-dehydrorhamnose reductase n=1 Tax=Alteristakelama amylovorans TaxID=3096166 RepID=UPI002FC85120